MKADRALAAVIVPDGAHLFEAAVPVSVFGVDRTSTGGPALRVVVATVGPAAPVRTTAGLTLSGFAGLEALDAAGVVIVPTWADPTREPPGELLEALRRAVDRGATVMGLCLGAFVLGYAGLLDGRRAVTHWHWLPEFTRRFPRTRVDESTLYVDEGQVITSAGTAAALDACLHYVRREWGAAAANAIARRMVVAPHRPGGQAQYAEPRPTPADDTSIAAVQARALTELPGGVTVVDLAHWYGTSRRTFDRDFRAATGQSPLQWLLHQRIMHAQRLLETTDLPVETVAHRAGFSSAVALRPQFRRILGVSPREYRGAFSVTDAPRGNEDAST